MKNIGLAIRNRRKELGLTQDELAKKCGYSSKSTIAKIEKGVNELNQSKIINIAKALDMDPSELFGYEPPKEKKATPSLDMSKLMNYISDDSMKLTYNGKELTPEQRAAAKAALSVFKTIVDAK